MRLSSVGIKVLGLVVVICAIMLITQLFSKTPNSSDKSSLAVSYTGNPVFSSEELSLKISNSHPVNSNTFSVGADPKREILLRNIVTLFSNLFRLPDDEEKLAKLDQAFHDFLFDLTISRTEKLQVLWELVTDLEGIQRIYVIDTMDALKPIELTSQIIGLFEVSDDSETKLHLLSMLRNTLGISETDQPNQDELQHIQGQSEIIYSFLKDQLSTQNIEVRRFVLLEALPLLPEADIATVLNQATTALTASGKNSDGYPITPDELVILWLDALVAHPTNDAFMNGTSNLIELMLPDIKTSEFLERFAVVVEATAGDPLLKPKLRELFNKLKPNRLESATYYRWLIAKVALESSSQVTVETLLLKYFSADSAIGQAAIIQATGPDILNKLSLEKREQVIGAFLEKFKQSPVDSAKHEMFKIALKSAAEIVDDNYRARILSAIGICELGCVSGQEQGN